MPCFVGFGVYCSILRQSIGLAQTRNRYKATAIQRCAEGFFSHLDMRGNISKMETFFVLGQASLFDRLDGEISLLNVVFLKMTALPMRQDPTRSLETIKSLYYMLKFLITHNLDPSQLWTCSKSDTSPLPYLIASHIWFYPNLCH